MSDATMGRVAWKSKITGASGHGSWILAELAAEWVKHENKATPTIDHWVEYKPAEVPS